jgi:hypothetical protein
MTERSSAWIHVSVWWALVLFSVSRAYEGRETWSGWTGSSDFSKPVLSERIRAGEVVRTRANTWSNLACVLVAFYSIALGLRDRRRPHSAASGYLVGTPAMSLLFGAACCALGAGSGFFHASLTRAGQRLDVAMIYAPLLVFIALNVGRWIPRGPFGADRRLPTWPVLGGLAVGGTSLLYAYKWSMSARTVLSTLIATVAILGMLDLFSSARKLNVHWLVLAGVALAAGVLCRELDVAARFTGPDAWLQGHALWHVLTALCLGCMYFYYRSEFIPRQGEEIDEPHG